MKIAILGFGVVGSGVATLISEQSDLIEARLGIKLELKWILNRKSLRATAFSTYQAKSIDAILADPEIDVIVETIGGIEAAYKYTIAALNSGKHVVTSNKELIARYAPVLLELAAANKVSLFYEAAVGGGIPLLRSIREDLAANQIEHLTAILNGTCNYILEQMELRNEDFMTALADAQALGYAERDPSSDISGLDSCRKLAILCSRIYGEYLETPRIVCSGIEAVTLAHIHFAAEKGGRIKLLAKAQLMDEGEEEKGRVRMTNAAYFVSQKHPLYAVNGVHNAVMLNGSAVGDVMYYGQGAGSLPTASSVLSDIISIGRTPFNRATAESWSVSNPSLYVEADAIRVHAYLFPLTATADLILRDESNWTKLAARAVESDNSDLFVLEIGEEGSLSEADLAAMLNQWGLMDDVFILRILAE